MNRSVGLLLLLLGMNIAAFGQNTESAVKTNRTVVFYFPTDQEISKIKREEGNSDIDSGLKDFNRIATELKDSLAANEIKFISTRDAEIEVISKGETRKLKKINLTGNYGVIMFDGVGEFKPARFVFTTKDLWSEIRSYFYPKKSQTEIIMMEEILEEQ